MLNILGKFLRKKYFRYPIFVTGAGRSGTTVLLEALGRHPQIFSFAGESPFVSQMGHLIYEYEYSDIKDYYIRSLNFSKEYLYDVCRRLCFESAMGPNYGQFTILKSIMRNRLSIFKNKHWCAKTFPTFESSEGLLTLFPDAKFIYIFRNGIEVVHSRTLFPGFSQEDFGLQCTTWAQSVSKYDYLAAAPYAIKIRHEELLYTPEQVLKQVFAFVGIEENRKPLDFITSTIIHPLDKPTEKGVQVRELFERRQPAYKNWTTEQRELFKKICGNAMAKLGYEIPF